MGKLKIFAFSFDFCIAYFPIYFLTESNTTDSSLLFTCSPYLLGFNKNSECLHYEVRPGALGSAEGIVSLKYTIDSLRVDIWFP